MPKILTSNPLTRNQKLSQLLLQRFKEIITLKSLNERNESWSRTRSWRSGTRCPWKVGLLLRLTRTRSWHVDQSGLEDTSFDLRLKSNWTSGLEWHVDQSGPDWRHRLRDEVEVELTSGLDDTLKSNWRPAPKHKCWNPLSRLGFAISVVWNLFLSATVRKKRQIGKTRLVVEIRFHVLSQERQSWLLAKDKYWNEYETFLTKGVFRAIEPW